MIFGVFFAFWRFLQILTLIPTLGMLAWFVDIYTKANQLTPSSILTLFIVSVLACAWALATLLRRKSTHESAFFVSFVDICFVGAFIAGVYELRSIANQNCASFNTNDSFGFYAGSNGVSASSPFSVNFNKPCAMLKASFAFGIMNCIFFAITAFLLLFMRRKAKEEVVVKESYSRRRSHDSRRGHSHSRSGSGHHRSSRDYRSRPYV